MLYFHVLRIHPEEPEGGQRILIEGGGFRQPLRVELFAAGEEELAATVLSVRQTEVEVTLPRLPDSAFPEEACTVGGSPGMRFTDAVVDVNVTNLPTSCTDVFVGSFTHRRTPAAGFRVSRSYPSPFCWTTWVSS